MDLVALMKKEIDQLHLVDKRDIQNHLYQRIGEIFEYEPYWKFASLLEQLKIAKADIDIHNVTYFYAICFSIASMSVKLLKEFEIDAREEGNAGHTYVVTTIDGKEYIFDLAKGFEDFMRIKFGLNIHYHYDSPSKNDFRKYKDTEKSLQVIKQKLKNLMTKMNKDEYVYQVFLTIGNIISFYEPENVSIVSGVEFVNYLLKYFIGENYLPCNTRFFNKEDMTYVEVYSFIVNGEMHYFIYKKIDKYELFETDEETIRNIINNYRADKTENLILLKGQSGYLKYRKLDDPIRKRKKELRLMAPDLNEEEYIYETFKKIQEIISLIDEEILSLNDGVETIKYLITRFIGDKHNIEDILFRSRQDGTLVELYSFIVNGRMIYYIYQMVDGRYELFETTANYIRNNFINNSDEVKRMI